MGRGGGSAGGGGIGDSCGGVSGGGGSVGGVYSATRLMYVNERSGKQQDAKQQQQLQQQQQADYKAKARRIQRGTFSESLGLLFALHNFICLICLAKLEVFCFPKYTLLLLLLFI